MVFKEKMVSTLVREARGAARRCRDNSDNSVIPAEVACKETQADAVFYYKEVQANREYGSGQEEKKKELAGQRLGQRTNKTAVHSGYLSGPFDDGAEY